MFIFTVPILDFVIVTTYRISNNTSPTEGGTDHISHRLLNLGYSEKRILIEFIFISFFSYALLIATIFSKGVTSYIFAMGFVIFFIFNYLKYKNLDPLN